MGIDDKVTVCHNCVGVDDKITVCHNCVGVDDKITVCGMINVCSLMLVVGMYCSPSIIPCI